jgi:hypothetical protein
MLAMFADWTDRIANGEVPTAPRRPEGIERNVVITEWDWADPKAYLHDVVSTDRRNPTLNANGKMYGSLEVSADYLPVLDPRRNEASRVPLTVRDPKTPVANPPQMIHPSPYWGDEPIWTSRNNVHNPMLDAHGRVWITSTVRPPENPDVCKAGSNHPSAKLFPLARSGRQLAMYDPKTAKLTHISTCFSTHHLMFAEDANNTLWTSGGGPVVGWLNTKMFDETGDEEKSQGWTAIVLDTNGNGKRDEGYSIGKAADATKDTRLNVGFYAVSPSPVDGSIWGSIRNFPGALVRIVPGDNPPATAISEYFELPWDDPKLGSMGYGLRGMDIDTEGVVWVPLSSGYLGSFDRRKCKGPMNGPTATGKHCNEGWAFHKFPGPQFENMSDDGSVESSYYTWVDQHDTLGLGKNVPVATGGTSEGLVTFVDGKFVTLRIPYPMGFYAKGLDGRIDDPNGGWKARGLWSAYGSRAPFHMEGGKGTLPKLAQFQIRPDPLAR